MTTQNEMLRAHVAHLEITIARRIEQEKEINALIEQMNQLIRSLSSF